jgi:NAD(P)-dependent dehydrogenase (short-subunit alcohol dehydrogenase family)
MGGPFMRLEGRVTIITGATGGIGRAIADAFAAEGARLVLTGRRSEPGPLPKGARYLGGDVLDEAFVERLTAAARDSFGRLDILVNCHGLQFDSDLRTTDIRQAEAVLDTNVLGRC